MMEFPIVRLVLGACRNGQQQAQLQNRERPLVSLRYQRAFLFYSDIQNLNRFTMRSHRRVKKLPSWVVVSATAVFSAAATVSPVL
jgi:hypothetical protein